MKRKLSFNFVIGLGISLAIVGILSATLKITIFDGSSFPFTLTFESVKQIGFGLIGIGIIIVGLGAVGVKVEEHGFDFWALGAFISYSGILFLMAPFIFLLLNIPLSLLTSVGLILLGIAFAVFGFFYEAYELNIRFSIYIREIQSILADINPLRIIIAIFLMCIIFLSVRYRNDLFSAIGRYEAFGLIIGITALTLTVVLIDRAKRFFLALVGGLKVYLQYVGYAIKNFPSFVVQILRRLVELLGGAFAAVWEKFKEFSIPFIDHGYSITLIVGIIAAYIGFSDLQRVSMIFIFVFLAVVKLGVTYSSNIIQGVNRISSAIYTSSFTAQRAALRLVRKKILCPDCSNLISLSEVLCPNCGMEVPRCMICRLPIEEDQKVVQCPSCSYPAHQNHWEEWILMRKSCPRCRELIVERN